MFEDIDECDEESGDEGDELCPSGVCHNTIGSYVCLQPNQRVNCTEGFLADINNTCQGTMLQRGRTSIELNGPVGLNLVDII